MSINVGTHASERFQMTSNQADKLPERKDTHRK